MSTAERLDVLYLQWRMTEATYDWSDISCELDLNKLKHAAASFRSKLDYRERMSIEFRLVDNNGVVRFHAEADRHWALTWRPVN